MARRIVLVLASVGWLAPMALGVWTVLAFLDVEVAPRLYGQAPDTSFPHLAFARRCFAVAFAWLGAVVLAAALTVTRARPADTAGHD